MRATYYHAFALAMNRTRLADVLGAVVGIAVVVVLGALIGAALFGNP